MKSDIEIAQECTMLPIAQVAAKVGISEDDLDLYGKRIGVAFFARLRDERRFGSREALFSQIRADAQTASSSREWKPNKGKLGQYLWANFSSFLRFGPSPGKIS